MGGPAARRFPAAPPIILPCSLIDRLNKLRHTRDRESVWPALRDGPPVAVRVPAKWAEAAEGIAVTALRWSLRHAHR
jgi:hypothetical protein